VNHENLLCLTSIKYPLLSEIKNIAAVAFLNVYHTHYSIMNNSYRENQGNQYRE